MLEAIQNAFSGTHWPLGFALYLLVGLVVAKPSGGLGSRFMAALGWPLELSQRLAGATSLPYIFLLPNMLVFGIFTFAPMFINMGFSVTEGQSIYFDQRPYAGSDNLQRLLSETQIDTGGVNREDDKFLAAVADTFTFVIFQVPIMVLVALITALVLNRDIVGRGFWRSIFFYPVMLSPVVVGFLWTLILKRQGVLSLTLIEWGWIDEPIQWLTDQRWTMFWSVFVFTWSDWRVLRKITLPLLMPTLLVVTVLSLVKAFQAFEELYAMNVRWISLVSYIFETAGLRGQPTAHGLGVAATASLLVALVLVLLSLLQIYLSSRQSKS